MAKYTGPSCKLCRREGTKLYLKGERCLSDKCAFNRRTSAPGQHGAAKKKLTEYGMQLREKQKAKRYYGVLEKQFKNYYVKADNQEGIAGENLLRLLERRLDNVVYRMGLGVSRAEARQLVRHGHFTVNGKRVDIPSYSISEGDVVALCEKSRSIKCLEPIMEVTSGRIIPAWIDFDADKISGTITALPKREDIDFDIKEHLIVELYSK